MKTQLTADDPAGYYECQQVQGNRTVMRKWDGYALTFVDGGELMAQKYTNFRKLYTEGEVAESGAKLLLQKREIDELKAELSRLKSQPYPMRKADKPDCVGLWRNNIGYYIEVTDKDIASNWPYRPYYYLGPIPVVPKEQLPPKVVKVKHKEDGDEFLAIPTIQGTYMLLDNGGIICEETNRTSWEEVQS